MLNEMNENNLFCDYYEQWVAVYKEGAVRPVTLDKYKMTLSWVKRLAPDLKLCEVSRVTYQQLLNDYAVGHERQTTMDFHHQLKGAIMDAVDDGLIVKDPTRKAIIKGKPPVPKKVKYLNQFELHLLLSDLDLQGKLNWDWMILLIAKTGIRFSEALAITPADFDFAHQIALTALPVSSAMYSWPSMMIAVPSGITSGSTETVRPAVGIVPLFVRCT